MRKKLGRSKTESVNGNIRLVATQVWENPNLPVIASIDNAYREETGDNYKITVSYTKVDTQVLRGRLVTILKTADGKMVASDISDISAKLGIPGVKHSENVTINYNGRASTVEVVVVGLDGNNTGGAYSAIVASDIVAEKEWTDWSDCSTEEPPEGSTQIETKAQYRARSYETITSSSSIMDGWEKFNTTSTLGAWSPLSQTQPASSPNREIVSYPIPVTYKTQYNYYGYKSSSGTTRYHFCAGAGKYYWGVKFNRIDSGWRDTKISATSMTAQSYGGSHSGCTHSGRITISKHYGTNPYYYFEESRTVTSGGGFNYSYRDTTYTYHYRRFKDWTDWKDEAVSGDQTETRTMHRFRNEVALNAPKAGTEDTDYETYTITGNLQGTEEDFKGRIATILVYKKTNTDPTATHLQYMGQTTIGNDNSYDFSFLPREKPTAETNDFIVTLALEAANRIVKVDTIKAPSEEYTVSFFTDDGQLIETQTVAKGDTAVPPELLFPIPIG